MSNGYEEELLHELSKSVRGDIERLTNTIEKLTTSFTLHNERDAEMRTRLSIIEKFQESNHKDCAEVRKNNENLSTLLLGLNGYIPLLDSKLQNLQHQFNDFVTKEKERELREKEAAMEREKQRKERQEEKDRTDARKEKERQQAQEKADRIKEDKQDQFNRSIQLYGLLIGALAIIIPTVVTIVLWKWSK